MSTYLANTNLSNLIAGVILAIAIPIVHAAAEAPDPTTTLWYYKPAADWETESLPIGNGRLGATVFGGVIHERIALNEESVWSGSRAENSAPTLPRTFLKSADCYLRARTKQQRNW